MYGYIASHNDGRTLVLDDGRVFEFCQQPNGDQWYLAQEGVDIEAFATEAQEKWNADWTELQDEAEIREHIDLDEAANYYVGEPPRN